ncbi:MAG: hypothetical protein H6736_09750 [Alphaproteobacteria bacterium]|nr:hypothetical protein [Alphaproteobacteria bacterium]MCB9692083.1 hypothetical protein [Alphaproteobacteria bacterium]
MIVALLGVVLAQESDDDLDDPEVSETVIVYSKEEMDRAREAVIQELADLGYDKVLEKDGAIVLRHQQAWKGDVWLHDDGWMRIKRQPVRLEAPATPFSRANRAGAWAGCILLPFRCVRAGGQFVSERKFVAVETRTTERIAPDVSTWGDRVADYRTGQKIDGLPARLEALWLRGEPLEGEGSLASVEERKEALLRYWETRTDNPWGEAVRGTVEAFIRGEVQSSDTPFTDDEIASFNRRSRAGRALDLERR